MFYNLDNEIAKRATKNVYRDNDSTIKLFVENYSKSNILNEALNQARVEEGTDLNIARLKEITKIDKRWALVSEHIDGTSLQELMDKNPEKMDEYMDLFVKIQLEVLSKQVPMLNPIKDKYKRKITNCDLFDESTKFELLQRLAGMEEQTKLCHGDFEPGNIIIKEDGSYYIIDWAHVTQGNASADAARTFLIFSMQGKKELAEKYLDLFAEKSGIAKNHIQLCIPVVAAVELTRGKEEEKEFLKQWIDIKNYE
ncbi:MAG: phosphotransferase [Clostridia bacterium]|nr:phosphotransferase [Clostridia bacterium]